MPQPYIYSTENSEEPPFDLQVFASQQLVTRISFRVVAARRAIPCPFSLTFATQDWFSAIFGGVIFGNLGKARGFRSSRSLCDRPTPFLVCGGSGTVPCQMRKPSLFLRAATNVSRTARTIVIGVWRRTSVALAVGSCSGRCSNLGEHQTTANERPGSNRSRFSDATDRLTRRPRFFPDDRLVPAEVARAIQIRLGGL